MSRGAPRRWGLRTAPDAPLTAVGVPPTSCWSLSGPDLDVYVCSLSVFNTISKLLKHFTLVTFNSDLLVCFSFPEKPCQSSRPARLYRGRGVVRTQEPAIKIRAVTFRPSLFAGPRPGAQQGGWEAGVSPLARPSPFPRPLSPAGPAPAHGASAPQRRTKETELPSGCPSSLLPTSRGQVLFCKGALWKSGRQTLSPASASKAINTNGNKSQPCSWGKGTPGSPSPHELGRHPGAPQRQGPNCAQGAVGAARAALAGQSICGQAAARSLSHHWE